MSDLAAHHFTNLNSLSFKIRLGSFESELLYWGFIEPDYWRNYPHIHSFFEVCYAFQGKGTFRICTEEHHVYVGDLFVARPNEIHDIVSDQDDPLGIYFWAYTLHAFSAQQWASLSSNT